MALIRKMSTPDAKFDKGRVHGLEYCRSLPNINHAKDQLYINLFVCLLLKG